ncbi:hypothetical protein HK102_008068 [Quaeritorhiza haematococci]|nr:hypothetical protein HK102_008068 [Quaeritorhiza haematococci]
MSRKGNKEESMGFPDAKRILACIFGGVLVLATMAAHAFSASGLCGAAGEVMANVAIEHNDDLVVRHT